MYSVLTMAVFEDSRGLELDVDDGELGRHSGGWGRQRPSGWGWNYTGLSPPRRAGNVGVDARSASPFNAVAASRPLQGARLDSCFL